jgi:hypothetical protein
LLLFVLTQKVTKKVKAVEKCAKNQNFELKSTNSSVNTVLKQCGFFALKIPIFLTLFLKGHSFEKMESVIEQGKQAGVNSDRLCSERRHLFYYFFNFKRFHFLFPKTYPLRSFPNAIFLLTSGLK